MPKKFTNILKALSLDKRIQRVVDAFYKQFPVTELVGPTDYWVAETFDDYIIVGNRGGYFKVTYADDGTEIEFAKVQEWEEVERVTDWVKKSLQMQIALTGRNALKAVSIEDDFARVANYIVLFGDADNRDLENEYFTKETDLESPYTKAGVLYLDWEHNTGVDGKLGPQSGDVLGVVDWSTKKADDVGVWVERVLDRRKKYVEAVLPLVERGLIGTSSEAEPNKVKKSNDGEILKWPLKRDTLTVWPVEPRMMLDNAITPAAKNLLISLTGGEPDKDGGSRSDGEPSKANTKPNSEVKSMNLQELLEKYSKTTGKAIADFSPEDYAKAVAGTPFAIEVKPVEPAPQKSADPEDPWKKAVDDEIKSIGGDLEKVLQYMEDAPAINKSGFFSHDGGNADKNIKSFGDFLKAIERKDVARLKTLYGSVYSDYDDDGNLKAMAEASGTSGGYLVPHQFEERLLAVAGPGSIVRGSGAMSLPSGAEGSIPALDQGTAPTAGVGDTAFAGGVVGGWEGEASAGSESSPAFQMLEYHVRKIALYTYVSNEMNVDSPLSIEALLTNLFSRAIAAKEDHAFLRGDGVGKPLGILTAGCAIGITPDTNNIFAETDAMEMISRHQPVGVENAGSIIWAIHRSIIPDLGLFEVNTGGGAVYLTDMQTSPMKPLFGYPIKMSEHLPQANNSGCVILADMAAYVIFDRRGMMIDFSEHARFTNDQSTWRVTKRLDGKPWTIDAITYADPQGSYTVSPFVYLND